MTPTTRHALALPCALALMACSGADDPALPAVSTVPVTETLAPTTLPPPTTAAATAPRATSSTSVTPATTAAEPPDTAISVEDEVIAAYLEAYEAYHEAAQAPDEPVRRRAVAEYFADDQLDFVMAKLDDRLLRNEVLRPNAEVDDVVSVESVTVDGGRATLVVCEIDPWIVVSRHGGLETVVDDDTYVYREQFDLEYRDGSWLIVSGLFVEDLSESGTCEG